MRADVRREDDVRNLIDKTVERYGRLDVAVSARSRPPTQPTNERPRSEMMRLLPICLAACCSLLAQGHTQRAPRPAAHRPPPGQLRQSGVAT
jgi:NAD(P)-dependent dehydrogenase (short-subunit alcohol dehydrogenase family)